MRTNMAKVRWTGGISLLCTVPSDAANPQRKELCEKRPPIWCHPHACCARQQKASYILCFIYFKFICFTPTDWVRLHQSYRAQPRPHTIPYPGRHQEQAPKQRCTFRPTTFSSVQFSPTSAYRRSARVSPRATPETQAHACAHSHVWRT